MKTYWRILLLISGLMFTLTANAATSSVSCTNVPNWNVSTAYSTPKMLAIYNGVEYTNNWWTQGDVPDLNNGSSGTGKPWTIMGGCSSVPTPSPSPIPSPSITPIATACSGLSLWNATTAYVGDTFVIYNNIEYRGNWWTQNNRPDLNNGPIGSGQPWTLIGGCSVMPTPSPSPSVIPSPTPSPTVVPVVPTPTITPPTPGTGGSVVFSPYKDVTINANWNTSVMSSVVTGPATTLVNVLPSNVQTVTWAFATGECGAENWGGMLATKFANANMPLFKTAGKNYIISTGGAAGVFTCSTHAGMQAFLNTYMSPNLIGLDFDMEGGQSPTVITSLVNELVYAQSLYPNLRISFTLASLADSSGGHGGLNALGDMVIKTAKAAGLNFYINLMVMDYGAASSVNCVVAGGVCEMALSAEQAVTNLQYTYGIPSNRIELTPMIGNNDTAGETLTLADAQTLGAYVANNGLAGLHYWSFDRDTPCALGVSYASPTCNSAGVATLGYTNAMAAYFK